MVSDCQTSTYTENTYPHEISIKKKSKDVVNLNATVIAV